MKNQDFVFRPRIARELKTAYVNKLNNDDIFKDCMIERCTLSGITKFLNMERTCLRNVTFEASLRAAEFEDVVFEGCDLSNVDLSDAILLRVSFINCRMTGVNFSGATFKDITFENNLLNYSNFHFAHFEKTIFLECSCKEADLAEAIFSKIQFSDTNLQKAQLSGTPLSGVDFTSCNIDGLCARPEDLRGAVFSFEQAVTAAQILGIVIR